MNDTCGVCMTELCLGGARGERAALVPLCVEGCETVWAWRWAAGGVVAGPEVGESLEDLDAV